MRNHPLNFFKGEIMMKCLPSMVRILLLALGLTAGQALANITYTFSGATFAGGGTLTGTFTTNDSFNSLLTYNITTSAALPNFPGFNYTPANSVSTATSLPFILVLDAPTLASPTDILEVTFTGGLTATGAAITVGPNDSFEQHNTAKRNISGGGQVVAAVVAVPEPETYAMLLAGLGLMGFAARRRKQPAA